MVFIEQSLTSPGSTKQRIFGWHLADIDIVICVMVGPLCKQPPNSMKPTLSLTFSLTQSGTFMKTTFLTFILTYGGNSLTLTPDTDLQSGGVNTFNI